jgi:hypothetical protein
MGDPHLSLAEAQKWREGVTHGHDLVAANMRRIALHRREDATLCVCMTCGITWREDANEDEWRRLPLNPENRTLPGARSPLAQTH